MPAPDHVRDQFHQAAQAAKVPLVWRSCAEILAACEVKPREWLVEELIPFGAAVIVVGIAKRAGKSTFLWSLCAAAELGTPFLGRVPPRTGAVIASEEGDHDLAKKIRLFGLEGSRAAVLSRGALSGLPDWEDLVREASAKARSLGHRILGIDTFSHWSGIEENDAKAMQAALRPVQEAADAGLAVVIVHHPGKVEDRAGGMAARGSSALPAAVEGTIEIRYAADQAHPNRRRLYMELRDAGVRDLLVDLVEGSPEAGTPATYALVGEANRVQSEDLDGEILRWLREHPGWHRRDDVTTAMRKRTEDMKAALPRLHRAHRIARSGKGCKGSPYLYGALGTMPPKDPAPPLETPSGFPVPDEKIQVPGPECTVGSDSGPRGGGVPVGNPHPGPEPEPRAVTGTEEDACRRGPGPESGPTSPPASPLAPPTCPACRSQDHWRNHHGARFCRTCHPPAPGVEVPHA